MDNNINLNINTAREAASINADKEPLPATLEKFIEDIETFFRKDQGNIYMSLKDGLHKNAHNAFSISSFLKNINLLLYNLLKENNKDNIPLLKSYFDGMNTQLKVLDAMNLKLSEREFVANIIGYALNCYKNNSFKIQK
jgi:hypothetical protein